VKKTSLVKSLVRLVYQAFRVSLVETYLKMLVTVNQRKGNTKEYADKNPISIHQLGKRPKESC